MSENLITLTEELTAELATLRRLIERLHHDIARLTRQQDIVEAAAAGDMVMRKGSTIIDHGRGTVTRDEDDNDHGD